MKKLFLKKRILCIVLLVGVLFVLNATGIFASDTEYTERDISVVSNGELLTFDTPPLIINERTVVPVRTIAESIGCDTLWDSYTKEVTARKNDTDVVFKVGEKYATVIEENDIKTIALEQPAMLINGRTYLPLRAVGNMFGMDVNWDEETSTVTMEDKFSREYIERSHTYYFQNQSQWQFENYGSGYCWVCCYAMVLNDLVGDVTPLDVAVINQENGPDGAYCQHFKIAEKYGVRFVSGLSEDSPYFERYDPDFGATYIKNPFLDDLVVTEALKEALDNHKEGVLVRFEKVAHTLVAIGYSDEGIIFNEPQPTGWGEFREEGEYKAVTFDNTYLYAKGLTLSDMAYIQTIELNT